ncbi:MAG: radical SAM protein [Deltaproteobacteria bacterium]|nr:radical SAM protein [Deltaproteobacteria bacterium]
MRKLYAGISVLWAIVKIKFFGRRIPVYCEWELTHSCNLDCRFCSTGASSNYNPAEESPTDRIYSQMDQLKALGVRVIHFSGGEPTLKKDFLEIVRYAKAKGIVVVVTSNGVTNKQTIRALLEADLVRISIDGKEELHDSLRRRKGSFGRAIETVKELNQHGIQPLITCVVTKETTLEGVVPLMELIKKEFRAKITFIKMGPPITDKHLVSMGLMPDINEFLTFFEEIKKRYSDIVVTSDPYLPMLKAGGLDKYGCRAVDIAIVLDPQGHVKFPCNALVKWKPKIENNLVRLYRDPKVKEMARKQGRYPQCKGCAVRCMASASAMLKTGGLSRIAVTYLSELLRKHSNRLAAEKFPSSVAKAAND